MSVEFDKKIIIYWWLMANLGLLTSFIGIPLMLICFIWLDSSPEAVRTYERALTARSLNMYGLVIQEATEHRSRQTY